MSDNREQYCLTFLVLFSCFHFMVEYTCCCLGIAWVSIDFFPLCCVGRCLMQGFRDRQGFVLALCTFSMFSPSSTLFILHKKHLFSVCHPPDTPWLLALLESLSGLLQGFPPGQYEMSLNIMTKISQRLIPEHLGNLAVCNALKMWKLNRELMKFLISVDCSHQ